MTTALILIVSGVLIGAGLSIILRDVQRNRRRAFVSERDARAGAEPDIEITISHADRQPEAAASLGEGAAGPAAIPTPAPALTPAPTPALDEVRETIGVPRSDPDPSRQIARPSLEQQWSTLQAAIGAGVEQTNAQLAPTRLSISASGEPAWSYKNRGYGGYRRILLGRDSMAWLRLELSTDARLHTNLKAHKDDRAEINAAGDVPIEGLNASRVSQLLLQCLQSAVGYVARQQTSRDGEEVASEQAWNSVDALVTSALKATNGALAQAGARLVPLAPVAWELDLRRHRMTLCIEVNGDDVARMHIERLPHEMEVAVGVRDARLVDLSRRRRLPVEGMTIHALAELIAGCAWPAIARFRENRRPA